MTHRWGALLLGIALAWGASSIFAADKPPALIAADRPTYIVLRPTYGGTIQPVTAPAYAWGWFGAQPRPQNVGSSGYYGEYWQWSHRPGY